MTHIAASKYSQISINNSTLNPQKKEGQKAHTHTYVHTGIPILTAGLL